MDDEEEPESFLSQTEHMDPYNTTLDVSLGVWSQSGKRQTFCVCMIPSITNEE
jgi:hypothetical protein